MPLLVFIVMAALLGHDEVGFAPVQRVGPHWLAFSVLAGYAALVLATAIECSNTLRNLLNGGNTTDVMDELWRFLAFIRWLAVCGFIVDLYGIGWLWTIRHWVGDRIFLDEALAAAPVLLTLLAGWWFLYPIDRSLRGEVGTRFRFVLSQVRTQMLLYLVPLAMMMAWMEFIDHVVLPREAWLPYAQAIRWTGYGLLLLFLPTLMRWVWETREMPAGPLRVELLGLCERYGVRVRGLLLWKTWGGAVNGGVMGLIAPARYILLTDGLIERFTPRQVEAVMAHELAHVRKRHLPWMLAAALAVAVVALRIADWMLERFPLGGLTGRVIEEWMAMVCVVAVVVVVLGWVSRRFEREADAFAVRHLAERYPVEGSPLDVIARPAVDLYVQTLTRVAQANQIPMRKRDWRHGSMGWRCRYVESLAGIATNHARLHAVPRAIRLAAGAILLAWLLYDGMEYLRG